MKNVAAVVHSVLGKPWKVGAKGPDEFDCWGLVQFVQRELAGREVVDATDPPTRPRNLMRYVAEHEAMRQWRQIDEPKHLCAVLLAHMTHPFHVGTYLDVDGGVILHSQFSTGVTVDRPICLTASGWRRITYYEWIG